MLCKSCNNEILDSQKYCGKCGVKLEIDMDIINNESENNQSRKIELLNKRDLLKKNLLCDITQEEVQEISKELRLVNTELDMIEKGERNLGNEIKDNSVGGKGASIINKVNVESEGESQSQIKCLKCGSVNVWIGKKGFGFAKAAIGVALLGPIGAAGGLIGSKKMKFVCQTCGHKWTYL